jgi:Ca-activated chloride channel family protein
VVYAGASGLVLPSTGGGEKGRILEAIDGLSAGGSTNGGAGIELAYAQAQEGFVRAGTNRVILATDGDWNVGVTDRSSLIRLIEEKARSGVFLTVLGYGMDNLKDGTLEQLADKGNGNYGYVDTLAEARRLLVEQAGGTLVTVAKDVKIQVDWNPARVAAYRLVGYENRRLAARDFEDDRKDAGEIGAGHEVTAFYEVVPSGVAVDGGSIDPSKYRVAQVVATDSAEMLTVRVRSKRPDAETSTRVDVPFLDDGRTYASASTDLKFAASVATFAMLLRGSEHKGTATYEAVLELAGEGVGRDEEGYRREFVNLVERAKALAGAGR